MFKISSLTLHDYDGHEFTYQFSAGLNYFRGKNNTGKTEFYGFLDYMFGSSENISKKPWYRDSLSKAVMEIWIDKIKLQLIRTSNPEENYCLYADETPTEVISLREYREKLNAVFAKNIPLLRSIREFTEEELTYRAFTMFNFLGEKRQGAIHDFFDKCSDIRYSVKLSPILNFIFNGHLEEIHDLQQELERKQKQLKESELATSRYSFVCDQVNKNLHVLDTKLYYTGNNETEIRKGLDEIGQMIRTPKSVKEMNIAELQVLYNNISEQIKVYDNTIADAKQFESTSENRKLLLKNLEKLIEDSTEFAYLVDPISELLRQVDSTIAFSQYTISDKTIAALKKQQEKVKQQIRRNDARFKCYTVEDKVKAIALIDEYLTTGIEDKSEDVKLLHKEIRELKDQILFLQNADDKTKISNLSQYITDLYESARSVSSVVENDSSKKGFKIQYIKRGNVLQPMVTVEEDDEETTVNYYVGSLARHTLIQLCGYLAFLKLLIEEEKYPIIPILVVDHVSKPFDVQNAKALGQVITKAHSDIGKENLQIFMFDHKEHESLNIEPDHVEDLATENKTGFNPFYTSDEQPDS